MGAFDDLIPDGAGESAQLTPNPSGARGLFDDLVPSSSQPVIEGSSNSNRFADLIPRRERASPISRAAPIVPADSTQAPPSFDGSLIDDAAARPAPLLPERYRDLPEASAVDSTWWERLQAGFARHDSPSQNLGDLISDRMPRIDPATGQWLTVDERRGERLAREAAAADALPVTPPVTLGDTALEVMGAVGKEAADPLALMTGMYGAGATGLARLAKLAGAGGAYEGLASLVEQLSDSGRVTSQGEIAARAAIGAVAAPVLDVAIRGIGLGIKKLLAARKLPGADTESIDAQVRAGVEAAQEQAAAAGVAPEEVTQRLFEVISTPEGDVAMPTREPFDLPALAGDAPAAARPLLPSPQDAPPTEAPTVSPAAGENTPDATGRRRADLAQLANEYDRLARATTDPSVRTELLQKAEAARGEARGQPLKQTPAQRMQSMRRVDPGRDSLDVAIRKLGGIDTELENDWQGRLVDAPRMFGLPALERPGKGRSLDHLAERLFELGYIRNYDQAELAALLARVERGETVYAAGVADRRLEADLEEGLQRTRASDRDYTFEPDGADPAVVDRDFVIDGEDGTVVPSRPIELEDLSRLEEEELNARAFFEREAEGATAGPAEQRGGLPSDGGSGVPSGMADPFPRRASDQPEPREALELRGYTADELRAAAERRARLDAEEAAAQRAEAARADADSQRQGFALRGSERSADANPGQGDLLAREGGAGDYNGSGNERETFDVQQRARGTPGATDDRRGGDAVSPQLELFTREGESAAEPMASLDAFGQRVRYTQSGTLTAGTRTITGAGDAAHVAAGLRKEPQEAVLAIVTDARGEVLRVVRHTVGTRDASQVDPGLLAAAAHSTPQARQVWFVHQHPSGNAAQSQADARLTERMHELLRDTGVQPRGMIVVAPGGKFTHFDPDVRGAGVPTPEPIPGARRTESLPVSTRRFRRSVGNASPVSSVDEMRSALDRHAGNREGILLLDTRHQPVGFLPMTPDEMVQLRRGEGSPAAEFLRALDETNASAHAAIVETPDEDVLRRVHGNLRGFAGQAGTRHLDTLNADGTSATERGMDYTPSTFYANPFNEALKFGARSLRNNTAAAVPGALGGGMYGGALSDEEPGSARWWTEVGFAAAVGAGASMGVFSGLRRAGVTGKGGIADLGVQRAGEMLGKLWGRGPTDLEAMKRQRQVMREFLDRQTAEMGVFLRDKFTPSERALMADLIENRGIMPELNRVHTQAKALDDYLSFVTRQMKEYGLLPPGVEEGGYLHRYYAKHLGLDTTFREAKRQSLSGSYTIARGMVDTFKREFMSPGVATLTDDLDSLVHEKSLLERGLYEKAAAARGAREVDVSRVRTLPDEVVLRSSPGPRGAPSMSIEDALKRSAELDEEIRALQKHELVEMLGVQDGKPRSFFFTRDELGRVEGDPLLARVFKPTARQAPAAAPQLEGPLLQPSPGASPAGADAAVMQGSRARVDELTPTDRVWTLKGTDRDGVQLKRDWTKAERERWGEIRDAGYRFVRGMAEASHDLSLGKFFRDVSKRRDWVSSDPRADWVQVPKGKAQSGAGLERYGALAGKYVRPDVWRALKSHGVAPRVLGSLGDVRIPLTNKMTVIDAYRGALNRWKVWHTVYNPVSHFNNTYSNTEMLYMGGYGAVDLARGLRELARGEKSGLWREARDAGLLDGDWGTAVLQGDSGVMRGLEDLAEAMRLQRDDTDITPVVDAMMRVKEWWISSRNAVSQAQGPFESGRALGKAMGQPTIKGLKFLKKPVDIAARGMERAYRFEDNVFKMAAFAAERRKGATIERARQAAEDLFFDYRDLPDTVRFVRDFPIGLPFVSYAYKALPAIARNAVCNPERMLGLVLAYEAANYTMLVNEGMDPDRYLETMDAYNDTLPSWDSGRSLWGARNFVLAPGLGQLVALGRSHAVGNPFMAESGNSTLPGGTVAQALGARDIAGSNPLRALLDIGMNEDWKGKRIYLDGDTEDTKTSKSLWYLYQAWAPSNIAVPFGYHQSKVMDGLANEARENPEGLAAPIVEMANAAADALGLQQYTGLDRAGKPVDAGLALVNTTGVKLRNIDTVQSVTFELKRVDREIAEKVQALKEKSRLRGERRISQDAFDEQRESLGADIAELKVEKAQLNEQRAKLREAGLLTKQGGR